MIYTSPSGKGFKDNSIVHRTYCADKFAISNAVMPVLVHLKYNYIVRTSSLSAATLTTSHSKSAVLISYVHVDAELTYFQLL